MASLAPPAMAIPRLFQQNQSHASSRHGLLHTLVSLRDGDGKDEFNKQLWTCVEHALVAPGGAHVAVTRTLELAAMVMVDQPNEYWQRLLELTCAKNRWVRTRTLQLIHLMLKAFPDGYEMDDHVFASLTERLVTRLADKIPAVREEAIQCTERLQQQPTGEEEDVFTAALIRVMRADPNKQVRKSALKAILATPHTYGDMCALAQDESDDVRVVAIKELANRVPFKTLSLEQKLTLIDQGLGDRAKAVRDATAGILLTSWLQQNFSSPEIMIESLDCLVNEDVVVKCIVAMLHACEENGVVVGTIKPITPGMSIESALVCRARAAAVASSHSSGNNDDDTILETIVPDAATLEQVISQQMISTTTPADVFVLRQFAIITSKWNAQRIDPSTRTKLQETLLRAVWIPHGNQDLVEATIGALHGIVDTETNFVSHVVRDLSNYIEPLDHTHDDLVNELQELERQLHETRATKQALVRGEDYAGAAELKKTENIMEQRKAELETQLNVTGRDEKLKRCLMVACGVLRRAKLGRKPNEEVSAELLGLFPAVVYPAIASKDAQVRELAAEAMGLLAILQQTMASEKCVPVLRAMMNNQEESGMVRAKALEAIFDVLLVWGGVVLQSATPEAAWDELLVSFMGFLECDMDEVGELPLVATKGLCKLLFVGRTHDARLLQCLLIVLFHPSSNKHPRLRQCLGVFFSDFCRGGLHNQVVVKEAAMPTVRSVVRAIKGSMCDELPVDQVLHYLAFLLVVPSDVQWPSEHDVFHAQFAEGLLRELLEDGGGEYGVEISKTLLELTLVVHVSKAMLARLGGLVTDVLKKHNSMLDGVTKRNLNKFGDVIKAVGEGRMGVGVKGNHTKKKRNVGNKKTTKGKRRGGGSLSSSDEDDGESNEDENDTASED